MDAWWCMDGWIDRLIWCDVIWDEMRWDEVMLCYAMQGYARQVCKHASMQNRTPVFDLSLSLFFYTYLVDVTWSCQQTSSRSSRGFIPRMGWREHLHHIHQAKNQRVSSDGLMFPTNSIHFISLSPSPSLQFPPYPHFWWLILLNYALDENDCWWLPLI